MKISRKKWKKNLYENTDYEDNYTDPTFLKDLQTNKNVKMFTYTEAIKGATLLNNQISCITGFLLMFYFMYTEKVHPTQILFNIGLGTFLGYICYRGKTLTIDVLIEDSKTSLTVLVFGYIFSPLLHTLTDAVSTDTIFSMTFFVMFLNLIFFDYGLNSAIVSKAISLNAAIFGAICLASRLSSQYHAFVLLVVSAVFFVLYPILTSKFWESYFLIPIASSCCYCLYFICLPVLYTYVFTLVFINLVCPFIFVSQQKHKNNIHGPWDEAIVTGTTTSLSI